MIRKALLLVLLLLATSHSADLSPLRMLGTDNGRFVFGDLQDNEMFMLDTKTGRLWKLVGNAQDPVKLVPVRYVVLNAKGEETGLVDAPKVEGE